MSKYIYILNCLTLKVWLLAIINTQYNILFMNFTTYKLSGASSAPTVNTLDDPSLLKLAFRYAANAVGGKVSVPRLNTPQTTQVLIPCLLPLGDKVGISYFLVQTVLVQLSADRFSAIKQVVNVTGLLMVNFKYWP